MMSLYYEASDGTIIDFMSGGIYAQNPETLVASEWKYKTVSGINGLAKIKKFYKDAQELPLKLSIMAADAEEFNAIMYRMHRAFERDVRRMRPGKIWWNGFYLSAFITDNSYSDFEELFESIEKTLTVTTVYPYWVKEIETRFLASEDTVGTLDFPYDYGFDYDNSEAVEIIENDCIESANFKIIFYGPAREPKVTINGHDHALHTELTEGEYAVVDSTVKKIFKYSQIGEQENIFNSRERDSYIFEKIPEGTNTILRSKELGIDIIIFDERGEPEWI